MIRKSCRYEAEIDGCQYVVIERPDGNETSFIPLDIAKLPIPNWKEYLSADVQQILDADFCKTLDGSHGSIKDIITKGPSFDHGATLPDIAWNTIGRPIFL